MSNVRITWKGDAYAKDVEKAIDKAVSVAALGLASQMTRNMGSEGGGIVGLQKGELNRTNQRAKFYPSPDGAFPGVRTGTLRRSMATDRVASGRYRVGTNVRYGFFLEVGTVRMRARPWAARSLREYAPRLRSIFKKHAAKNLAKVEAKYQ